MPSLAAFFERQDGFSTNDLVWSVPPERSLNVAVAAAMVVGEAVRQIGRTAPPGGEDLRGAPGLGKDGERGEA